VLLAVYKDGSITLFFEHGERSGFIVEFFFFASDLSLPSIIAKNNQIALSKSSPPLSLITTPLSP
jgi:hypothetical protein